MRAFTDAHPLSPRGVKEALERVKMLPAASGAPGTRVSLGKWTRRAWMGAGYLVARDRWTPTASTRTWSIASERKADSMTTEDSAPTGSRGTDPIAPEGRERWGRLDRRARCGGLPGVLRRCLAGRTLTRAWPIRM